MSFHIKEENKADNEQAQHKHQNQPWSEQNNCKVTTAQL
jgi:hypothetical protein